jgi:hypothetical protein
MARTIGLSIYKDLKLRKKEGESSGVVWKGAFMQLTGHVLANGLPNRSVTFWCKSGGH